MSHNIDGEQPIIDHLPSTQTNREVASERFREWSRSYRGAAILVAVNEGSARAEDEMIAAFLESFSAREGR